MVQVNSLEKVWILVVSGMIASMLIVIFYTAFAINVHPLSNVETVDSNRLHLTEEFAEDSLGPTQYADGSITVCMVVARYGFYPPDVEVPASKPLIFRFATPDVIQRLQVPGTNVDTALIPGFVSEMRTVINYDAVARTGQIDESGKLKVSMFCNEYCGLGHHYLWSRIAVLPAPN